jgi:hypothetical protein
MRTTSWFRNTTLGWILSWTLSLTGVMASSTVTSAICNYGWCGGPPPGYCIQFCGTDNQLQYSYFDWNCLEMSGGTREICSHYICYYYDSQPGDVCQYLCTNSDYWECGL